MELRQLRYFVKTAALLNFTEAAKSLFVTQSTLSQQIMQLENELGIPLFDRVAKKVFLTEAGIKFLPFAQKTLRDSENGIQQLRDLQDLRTGELNIGVVYSIIPFLPAAISQFSKLYPLVEINIGYHQTNSLYQMLHERRFDMVICYRPVEDDPLAHVEPLFNTYLSVVMARSHPLSSRKTFRVKELESYPLILPFKTFYARSMFDALLQKHHVTLHPQMEINAVSLIQQLVVGGQWITVMPDVTVRTQPQLVAIPLADKVLMQPSMMTLNDSYEKNALQYFKKVLADAIRQVIHY